MIQLTKSGNAILFTFDENDHYLYNGTIEVPVNSLSLVTDSSEMFTFKKSATNDIFVSGLYSEIGMTKSELETFYKENMVGGGITSGEVQTMIDESISGKADTSAVTESINAAVSGKADTSAVTQSITEATSGLQVTLVSGTNIKTINNESILGSGNITISSAVTRGDTNAVQGGAVYDMLVELGEDIERELMYLDYNKQDTLISGSNIKTINNESILGSGNITISGGTGGNPTVELTQAEYDALVSAGTVDNHTYYIITDATPIDLSGYAQTPAVTEEIAAPVSGKADTSAVTESINAAVSGKVDTSAVTTSVTSASTDSQIPTAKAVYDAIPTGGTSITIDPSLDSGSTNPVANSAITTALNTKTDISSVTIYEYGNPSTYSSAFVGGKTAYGFSVSGITTSIIWYFRVSDGSTLLNYGINNSGNFYNYAGEQISIPSFINTELTKFNNGVFDVYFNTNNFYADYFPNTTNLSFTIYESFTLEPLKTKVEENTTALGGLKLQQITQAAYDALVSGGTVDSSTVYIIVN